MKFKLPKSKKLSEMTLKELDRDKKDYTLGHYFLFGMTILLLIIGCYAYGRLDKFSVQFVALCFGMTGFVWATSIYDYVLNLEIEIEKLRREIK
jgi:hypothetical protein